MTKSLMLKYWRLVLVSRPGPFSWTVGLLESEASLSHLVSVDGLEIFD